MKLFLILKISSKYWIWTAVLLLWLPRACYMWWPREQRRANLSQATRVSTWLLRPHVCNTQISDKWYIQTRPSVLLNSFPNVTILLYYEAPSLNFFWRKLRNTEEFIWFSTGWFFWTISWTSETKKAGNETYKDLFQWVELW